MKEVPRVESYATSAVHVRILAIEVATRHACMGYHFGEFS